MTNRLTVVHCIGCGRLDSPQACLTACEDQPLELVFAADYDTLGDVSDPFRGVRAMRDLLSRLVFATPHPGQPDSENADGEREQTYRALQMSRAFDRPCVRPVSRHPVFGGQKVLEAIAHVRILVARVVTASPVLPTEPRRDGRPGITRAPEPQHPPSSDKPAEA
jgi:hypothetical protein